MLVLACIWQSRRPTAAKRTALGTPQQLDWLSFHCGTCRPSDPGATSKPTRQGCSGMATPCYIQAHRTIRHTMYRIFAASLLHSARPVSFCKQAALFVLL